MFHDHEYEEKERKLSIRMMTINVSKSDEVNGVNFSFTTAEDIVKKLNEFFSYNNIDVVLSTSGNLKDNTTPSNNTLQWSKH